MLNRDFSVIPFKPPQSREEAMSGSRFARAMVLWRKQALAQLDAPFQFPREYHSAPSCPDSRFVSCPRVGLCDLCGIHLQTDGGCIIVGGWKRYFW